jgi:hypothetical protein
MFKKPFIALCLKGFLVFIYLESNPIRSTALARVLEIKNGKISIFVKKRYVWYSFCGSSTKH